MPQEHRALTQAQQLLRDFEKEPRTPVRLTFLTDAFALLADVAAEDPSPARQQQCTNLATTYARDVQRRVDTLLHNPTPLDEEDATHWMQACATVEGSECPLPADITAQFTALWVRYASWVFDGMSDAQMAALLTTWQARRKTRT